MGGDQGPAHAARRLTLAASGGELAPPRPRSDRGDRGGALDGSRALSDTLRRLLDADRTAVVLLDLQRRVSVANQTALALFGCESTAELRPGTGPYARLQSVLDHAPRHLAEGRVDGVWQGDVDLSGPSGEGSVHRTTVLVDHGDPARPGDGFIGVVTHDVTSVREEEARLRHRASHDVLTGLANRRQILATLTRAIGLQRRRPGSVATVFVDLDRLKYVNDALGHQIGDRLLVSASRRLAAIVRPHDEVARIGGDEFLVVCTDIIDEDDAMEIAERIRAALTGRLRLRQLDLSLSVSIGVAIVDPTDAEASDAAIASALVSSADTAMYEAKSSGRGRSVLFTAEMQTATRERTLLGAELSRAIDDRLLTVDYQPVFSAVTGRAVGAEALVRWTHPTRGPIEPSDFVAVAEQSGTIGKLGQFVLEAAMQQFRRWHDDCVIDDDFAIHVNVSSVQLASSSFVSLVMALAHRHGVPHSALVLEARESTLLGRNEDVDRTVKALRRLGVRLAIDNFGTGANALTVFGEVGADILKIDASSGLDAGALVSDTRLLRAIVVLAHALELQVVAERVSSPELLDRVRTAGCDQVQGNLLAAPGAGSSLTTSTTF